MRVSQHRGHPGGNLEVVGLIEALHVSVMEKHSKSEKPPWQGEERSGHQQSQPPSLATPALLQSLGLSPPGGLFSVHTRLLAARAPKITENETRLQQARVSCNSMDGSEQRLCCQVCIYGVLTRESSLTPT